MSTATLGKRVQDFTVACRQLFIDGQLARAESGEAFETVNPATGEALPTAAEGGDALDSYTEVMAVCTQL